MELTCNLVDYLIKSRALKVIVVLSDRVAKVLPLETDSFAS